VRAVVLSVTASLLSAGCWSRPDVIFLTVDTLRADHVRALNPDSPVSTPNIDALAADGVLFTQAYSPISVTGPAFCTLHTGLEPGEHGVVMNRFRGGGNLNPTVETLAERLTERRYNTGAFVSGFTLRRALGLDQGFEAYSAPGKRRRSGERTAERAKGWLTEQWGPIFLWYHSYDVHGPLKRWTDVPAGPDLARGGAELVHIPEYQLQGRITDPTFYAERYAAAVGFTDGLVGALVAALKAEDRYDDALIVFTSDHGESFTERDVWFDHGTAASVEQLHVPLIIKYPEDLSPADPPGSVVERPAALRDVAPTVLDVLELPPLTASNGRSLWMRGSPPALTQERILMGESSHCKALRVLDCAPRGPLGKAFSARTAAWTVIHEATGNGVRRTVYDRAADPAEKTPAEQPVPAELALALTALSRERAAMDYSGYKAEPKQTPASVEEEEALRALGYIE